jgi:hypothetical protein
MAGVLAAQAQEMVTIPKARLQELERKEAELGRLKGELTKTTTQNAELKQQHQADVAKIRSAPAAIPVVTHPIPPVVDPLKPGEVIDTSDLAEHYRADAHAADQRYRKKTFLVRGQITGFDKPLFTSDYKLVLKTADAEIKVVCDFFPPEQYRGVFTTKNGTELVALLPDQRRLAIARVGENICLEGVCKGLRNSEVSMEGCEVKPRP